MMLSLYRDRGVRGERFVGLRLIPLSDALALTPATGLPSLRPITRVGVFPLASSRSLAVSLDVHCFPAFRMYVGFILSSPPSVALIAPFRLWLSTRESRLVRSTPDTTSGARLR
jgi:hypothetical protein